jgi:outer membrane protein
MKRSQSVHVVIVTTLWALGPVTALAHESGDWIFRVGGDWIIDDNWLLNASVWKIDIDTDASFNSALHNLKVGVDIDPWVYMISLGYRL